ncbi:MAG: methyltransferase domain-containing protein [Anaerolineales bacterium]|uniref:SAM-dependent methyltransferase n=1 Tax=Candidatus Villigracilis vicinus TaxID=3140679 RepID=UPI00313473DE|nr:methyltransferase domain-containing protein [Anaerolineales bacterium]
MPITTDSVRTYYDENTNLFLKFSGHKKAQNIHRTLWMENTKSIEDALNTSNALIKAEIESVAQTNARIADLGCGVGASLFYIYPRLQNPAPALGLTLSPVQARLAQESASQLGLQDHIRFAEGDFTSVPLPSESLDAVYSVEAVCHAVDPEKYFKEAGRLLRKGGKLILVDDYKSPRSFNSSEEKWFDAYIDGWYVPGVRSVEQTSAFANKYGLQLKKNDELTPHLRLRNLPDFLASTLLFLGEKLPIKHAIVPSMLGSMALQQCLYMKVVEYRMMVFEKIDD